MSNEEFQTPEKETEPSVSEKENTNAETAEKPDNADGEGTATEETSDFAEQPDLVGSRSDVNEEASGFSDEPEQERVENNTAGGETADGKKPAYVQDYPPNVKYIKKVKKPFPAWLTALITAFLTTLAMMAAYTVYVMPNIKPSAVISYSQKQGEELEEEDEAEGGIPGIISGVSKSVVCISGQSDIRGFFGFSTQTNTGTGVIISDNGYILTSNSLIGSNGEVTVNIDGKEYTAKLVGQDIGKDIAIVQVETSGLTPAVLGDSDSVNMGDTAIAIANVLGEDIGVSATKGIICGVNDGVTLSNGNSINLIQTDAITGDGCVGGCLINKNGEIIGMITGAVRSDAQGISLAIPSNDIIQVAESIINTGLAPSGLTIGIKGNDAEHGVTVESVVDDSPAKKAGIQEGDLILKADGNVVKSVSEINKIRDTHKKGDTIVLTVYREGEVIDINVVLE